MLAAQLNHRVTSGRVIDLQFLEIELSNLVHLGEGFTPVRILLIFADFAGPSGYDFADFYTGEGVKL
uniref:Uncharacterized protein n=1 Tax=Fagus sylvatica TaxID=28930 RepID=A0A2N9EFL5_FAGSY